eukprot:624682-Prorocentrum_minimum.AAC.3
MSCERDSDEHPVTVLSTTKGNVSLVVGGGINPLNGWVTWTRFRNTGAPSSPCEEIQHTDANSLLLGFVLNFIIYQPPCKTLCDYYDLSVKLCISYLSLKIMRGECVKRVGKESSEHAWDSDAPYEAIRTGTFQAQC